MAPKPHCEDLERFQSEAEAALLEARRVRRSRDLSIHEDAQLSREAHRRVQELIKHLLVGHDGQPCPAGDRPIVRAQTASRG